MPSTPPAENPIYRPAVSKAEVDTLLEQIPKYTAMLKEVCQENLGQAERNAPETVNSGFGAVEWP